MEIYLCRHPHLIDNEDSLGIVIHETDGSTKHSQCLKQVILLVSNEFNDVVIKRRRQITGERTACREFRWIMTSRALEKSNSRNPLNVSSEKIEETRTQINGDTRASKESVVTSPELVSSADISLRSKDSSLAIEKIGHIEDSTENYGQEGRDRSSCEKLQEELDDSNFVSSSLSNESDTTLLGLSEDAKWVRRNFKRPLTLAMRDILAKKPSNPIDFLALWLLNYRSAEERSKLRLQQDREVVEERKKIQQLLSKSSSKTEGDVETKKPDSGAEDSDGEEGIVDSNFQIYNE